MNSNTLLDLAEIYQNIAQGNQNVISEATETPEQKAARMARNARSVTPAARKRQQTNRAGRELLASMQADQAALVKAAKDRAAAANRPAAAPAETPAAVVRVLPSQAVRGNTSGRKDTQAMRAASVIRKLQQHEALDPVGKEDADIDNDRKKNTKSDKYLLNRRRVRGAVIRARVARESYSDWRDDLIEIANIIEAQKKNDKNDRTITGEGVKNNSIIKINPPISEAVEILGGTLIEMVELDEDIIFEGVLDEIDDSAIFFLTDDLIEETIEEFFYESLEDGYDLEYISECLIESLNTSLSLLNEEDESDPASQRRRSTLDRVKSAVKKVGKGVARAVGYTAGAAVRGAKAIGREVRAGYARGRSGASVPSSGSSAARPASSSTSTQSSSTSSSDENAPSSQQSSGSSKPGFLSRVGSALKSGLKKAVSGARKLAARGARGVAKGALGVARKIEKSEKPHPSHTTIRGPKTPPSSAGQRERVGSSSSSSTSTSRTIPRSSHTSAQTTSTKKPDSPVGSAENPRIAQPAKESKPEPKPEAKPTPTPAASKPSKSSSETAGQGFGKPTGGKKGGKGKGGKTPAANPPTVQTGTAKVEAEKPTSTSDSDKPKKPRRRRPTAAQLDALIASARNEEYEIIEKTLTDAEKSKKKEIFKSITPSKLKKTYPGRSPEDLESLRFAISTTMAKKIAEQLGGSAQPKQSTQQKSVASRSKMAQIRILTDKLRAVRSTPVGVENDISV